MKKISVTSEASIVKKWILADYPRYYRKTKEVKISMIRDFVAEKDVEAMYKYMEESEV